METLIVQPSSQHKLEALKAFLTALKIDFQTAEEKESSGITNSFEKSFGAFSSGESADELISAIRQSRTFTRQSESL